MARSKREGGGKTKKERLEEVRRRTLAMDKIVHHTPATLTNIHDQRLSSGSYGLDSYMKGGWPFGSLVVITGEPNVGKDMTINLTLVEQQKRLGDDLCAAFVYNEGEFDKGFARLQGAKLDWTPQEVDRLERISGIPLTPQQRKDLYNEGVGELDFFTAGSAEASMDILIELTKAGVYDFIVLNSIDGMVLEGALDGIDKERSITGASKGRGGERRALLLKQFLSLRNLYMSEELDVAGSGPGNKRGTVCFLITQWKTKHVGQQYTLERDMSGGWGLRFFAHVILELTRVKGDDTWLGKKDPRDPAHITTSHLVNYYFAKGKHGIADDGNVQVRYYKRDHREGDLYMAAGSIDETETLRLGLLDAGWICNRGSRGYSIEIPGREIEEIKGGYIMIDHWLRSNPNRTAEIRRLLTREEQRRWRARMGLSVEADTAQTAQPEQELAKTKPAKAANKTRESRTSTAKKTKTSKPRRKAIRLKKPTKK